MIIGPVPDESPISGLSENSHIMGWQTIRFGAMSPLSQSSLHGWIHAAISRERYMLWTRDLHHWIQQRRRFMKMCESIVPTPSTLKLWAPEVNQISCMNLACMGEFVWPYIKNATCYGHEICTIEYNKDWGLYVEALWQPHQIWSNEPLSSTIMCEFGLHGRIRVVISPEPYNLWTWIQQRWMFINIILCGNSALELKSTMFHEFCFRGCRDRCSDQLVFEDPHQFKLLLCIAMMCYHFYWQIFKNWFATL